MRDQTRVQRLIGALELTYDATNWLNIINRTGVDTYTDRRSTVYPIGAGQSPTGQIGQSTIQETQINNDLIARATHDFSENLGALYWWGLI
ncbi:hypothetical protein [Hymenobacter radiodurans]|uniref:hypothetical protein n=1 Tax=Hymenobacter radiodurans TaxID=2496028 RepID=UPI001058FF4C|nr:hypothetical protein [Hymenobacter radiodurans]